MDYVSVRATCKTVRRIVGLDKRSVDGDFQTAQMALVLDTPESIGQLYAAYKEYADGKKGIVYAINREHARHIADYYQNHGVNCCLIDSKTPRQERQQMVTDYLGGGRKGERFRSLPDKLQRISPISYIYYLRDLKMQTLRKNPPRFVD